MTHPFTAKILSVLENHFPNNGKTIFELSPLLQYINSKTRSANKGSKSRSSFANLYALYVLVEDYIKGGFDTSGKYHGFIGADFSPLLARMKKMPFGNKLQNHALNSRLNDEFHKYFPTDTRRPITRDVSKQKYWINESLMTVDVTGKPHNIARSIIEIVDAYVSTKKESFDQFIKDCEALRTVAADPKQSAPKFISSLLAPEKDARLFEIASYAILRTHFATEIVFIGDTRETVKKAFLQLFKTGRTNANDGGIDFVMRPLGRFFQVTETLDVRKYFLDIDKIERFPISFVIKTTLTEEAIRQRLRDGAKEQYGVDSIVEKYMKAVEDIFNTHKLLEIFDALQKKGKIHQVLDEIIKWSKVEFNHVEDEGDAGTVADEDEEDEE